MNRVSLRVLIAEDDPLVAEVIEAQLRAVVFSVVGRAADGRAAVELACALRPDVILMDIQMPQMGGIEAAHAIQERCPTPIVILTVHSEQVVAAQAAAAGVGAYLIKPAGPEELERAVTIARARFADLLELRRLNAELQEALSRVKTLSGLLPICSHCKKIRDDQGYWRQVEEYVQDHSEAEFTHGICPQCLDLHYGFMRRKGGTTT